MVGKVELIPLDEGNRITVIKGEKVIIGRGSSLGCNEKKISRHHAEMLLKDDNTLWIKPTHANPVFYRPVNGKTTQLAKDIDRELKDGDQIGLLPTTFYFLVNFSTDFNNNNDSDSDSLYKWKKEDEKSSPIRTKSSDDWSPIHGYGRSASNQDTSVFDFDDDLIIEPTTRIPCRRISMERKTTLDVEPKPKSPAVSTSPSIKLTRVMSSSPPSVDSQDAPEPEIASNNNNNNKTRKLPKWMAAPTASSSPSVAKPTTTTPKSSYSRSSSYTAPTSAKRHLSFEGESNDDINESSNLSDARSPSESRPLGKVLSKISSTKSLDSDSADGFDSVPTTTTTATTTAATTTRTPPPKKIKSGGKRRPACQFGASCYRKNPTHRAEQSHPGDSDYDDSKQSNDADNNDDNDIDKPECPFGKSCYRQNPQHKRDFRH